MKSLFKLLIFIFFSIYDANTESCSYYIEPNKTSTFLGFTFNYSGATYSNQSNETSIYFFADEFYETEQGMILLNETLNRQLDLWETEFKNNSIARKIDYVQNLKIEKYFKFYDAVYARGDFITPRLIRKMNFEEYHIKYNFSIQISNIQLAWPGQIYFVIQSIKRVSRHPIVTGAYINTTLQILQPPNVIQILECKSYKNEQAELCGRIVQTNVNIPMKIEVWGLQKNTIYKIFWTIANEIPRTIVVANSTVEEDEFGTFIDWGSIPQQFTPLLFILTFLGLLLII